MIIQIHRGGYLKTRELLLSTTTSSLWNTFVKLQVLKTAFHPPPPLSEKAAAQLEANWLTGTKSVTGVFSFQPFAESQHRHKADNNSGGPLLSKPPSAWLRLFPFFLAYFQQLQGCWYIPKEKNTPERSGGWGRRAHTRNGRSARRRSTGEGSFWRKWLLREEEEGQSCKRIRFQQAVRSPQRLMLAGMLVTSDRSIMDFHPHSASAKGSGHKFLMDPSRL